MALLTAIGGMFKWVMASLLVLNGGALIALLQNSNAEVILAESGKYFVLGAVFSIFAGIAATGFLAFIVDLRNVLPYLERKKSPVAQNISRAFDILILFICVGCMLASVIFFAFGAAAVGEAIAERGPAQERKAYSGSKQAAS